MAIITAFEAVKYSYAGRDYPTAGLCDLADQIEQEFAASCLGDDLYTYLNDELVPYPANVTEWDCNALYSAGQYAVYNGCTFESMKNANRTQPGVNADWQQLERFSASGANQLWGKYLRRILAQMVFAESLTVNTYKSGANGLTVTGAAYAQGDVRSANKGELNEVKANVLRDIERTQANMLKWLDDNAETLQIPWKTNCGGAACMAKTHRSRRWNFVK